MYILSLYTNLRVKKERLIVTFDVNLWSHIQSTLNQKFHFNIAHWVMLSMIHEFTIDKQIVGTVCHTLH